MAALVSAMPGRRSLLLRLVLVPAIVALGLVLGSAIAGGAYARSAGIIAGFVLVVDLATFATGTMQNLLVVLASLLFGAGIVEGVAQHLKPQQTFQHARSAFGDREVVGWGATRPGAYPVESFIGGKRIYEATYTIDADLLRHVESDPDGPTIAFFGDSFTFGDGIDDADTLPQQFADLAPGFHVMNLAFSGYGPSQTLREFEVGLYDKELLRNPRLFVLKTGPLHVERVACKPFFSLRGPRYVLRHGRPVYTGPCSSGLRRHVDELFAQTALDRVFISPLTRRPSYDDVVTYIAVVEAIAKLARDKYHVPLVLLWIDAPAHLLDGTGFTDEAIQAQLGKAGIHLVDNDVEGEPGQVLLIPGDGHPTGIGNRLIARKLYDDLKDTMPNVLDPGATHAAAGR